MAFEGLPKSAKVEREKKQEVDDMAEKAPFVSGLYCPKEDAGKQPIPPIEASLIRAGKELREMHGRRRYGPLRPPTEDERKLTNRMLGEKEDD